MGCRLFPRWTTCTGTPGRKNLGLRGIGPGVHCLFPKQNSIKNWLCPFCGPFLRYSSDVCDLATGFAPELLFTEVSGFWRGQASVVVAEVGISTGFARI
jgi:hypothetical protein